jgi:hypothetical protein
MLGYTASRSFVCLCFEVACIYAVYYLVDAPHSPGILDLFALCAYKYVALNLDIIIGLIFGVLAFYICFFGLALSTAVFMVRTLNGWLPSSVSAMGSTPSSPRFRTVFLMFALLQLCFSLFLIYPSLPAIHSSRGLVGTVNAVFSSNSDSNVIVSGPTHTTKNEISETEIILSKSSNTEDSLPIPHVVTPAQTPSSSETTSEENVVPSSGSDKATTTDNTDTATTTKESVSGQETAKPTTTKPKTKTKGKKGKGKGTTKPKPLAKTETEIQSNNSKEEVIKKL